MVMDLDIATNFTDLVYQERLLMNAEFKLSINDYLSDLLYSPVRSLAQVIAFNEAHPIEVNQIFLSSTLHNQQEHDCSQLSRY
jgi:amidase